MTDSPITPEAAGELLAACEAIYDEVPSVIERHRVYNVTGDALLQIAAAIERATGRPA